MKRLFFLACFLVAFSAAYSQDYQRAIGLRLGWDYGISYKQFIKGTHAIEGIATFRSWGVPGYRYSYFRITGLYLVHNPFPGVEGLQWYYGGGASISMYGGKYRDWVKSLNKDYGTMGIGIHAALGLDFKIPNAPINLSADWVPTFTFGSYYRGFAADYGAFAVRYTF